MRLQATTAAREALQRVTAELTAAQHEYGGGGGGGGGGDGGGGNGGGSGGGGGGGAGDGGEAVGNDGGDATAQGRSAAADAGAGAAGAVDAEGRCSAEAYERRVAQLRTRVRALGLERQQLAGRQVPAAEMLQFQERVSGRAW